MVFLKAFFTVLSSLVIVVSAVNYAINPYGVFGHRFLEEVLPHRPAIFDYPRFARPARVAVVRPALDVVLLGSSNVRDGLDPATASALCGCNVENFGISGIRIHEAAQFVEHLTSVIRPRTIVLGLDFFSFGDTQFMEGFDETLLVDRPTPYILIRALLSQTALRESAMTVAANLTGAGLVVQRTDGFRERRTKIPPGETVLGAIRDATLDRHKWSDVRSLDGGMAAFERLVAACDEAGVTLKPFFSPLHAAMLEALYASGRGPLLEEWKRRIVATARRPVWDFMTFNPVTTVALNRSNTFYYDGNHYRPEVGALILDRLFGGGSTVSGVAGFGDPITPQTIDAQLANMRAGRNAYHRGRAEDVARAVAAIAAGDLAIVLPDGASRPLRRSDHRDSAAGSSQWQGDGRGRCRKGADRLARGAERTGARVLRRGARRGGVRPQGQRPLRAALSERSRAIVRLSDAVRGLLRGPGRRARHGLTLCPHLPLAAVLEVRFGRSCAGPQPTRVHPELAAARPSRRRDGAGARRVGGTRADQGPANWPGYLNHG
jgi:hypothetical protein